MGCVYILMDPQTHAVCYVGATTNPEGRLYQHMAETLSIYGPRRGDYPYPNRPAVMPARKYKKYHWLMSLYFKQLTPVLVPVAQCPVSEKYFWEAFWGEIFGSCNELLNGQPFQRHRIALR